MADIGSLKNLVNELISSNQKLDVVATNTGLSAEVAIDALSLAQNQPASDVSNLIKGMSKRLELIATRLLKLDVVATNTGLSAELAIETLDLAQKAPSEKSSVLTEIKSSLKAIAESMIPVRNKADNETSPVDNEGSVIEKDSGSDTMGGITSRLDELIICMDKSATRLYLIMEDVTNLNNILTQWYSEKKGQSKKDAEAYAKFRIQLDDLVRIGEEAAAADELARKKEEYGKAKKGVLGTVAIGAFLIGLVEGFVAEIGRQFMMVSKAVIKAFRIDKLITMIGSSKIFQPLIDAWNAVKNIFSSKVVQPIQTLIKAISESALFDDLRAVFKWIKGIGSYIADVFDKNVVQLFRRAIDAFKNSSFVEFIKGSIKTVTNVFDDIMKTWKTVTDSFKEVKTLLGFADEAKATTGFFSKTLGMLSSFFGKIKTFANVFFKFGKTIGNLLGKLALPITIIMGLFDSVTGFIDGFKKTEGSLFEKILGGIVQGVKDLVTGMIGGLVDLVKGAIAWLLDAVGLDKAAEWLRGWSFKDVLNSIFGFFDKIGQLIGDALVWLIDKLNTLAEKIKDFLPSSVKKFFGIEDTAKTQNPKERGSFRSEKVLENGAKVIASEKTDEKTREKTRQQLIKDYGFTEEEVKKAVVSVPTVKAEAVTPESTVAPTVKAEAVTPEVVAPPVPTIGAEMSAMQKDTEEAQAAGNAAVMQSSSGGRNSTVSNSSSSVVYNNNMIPDRTSWQITPAYALG